jgi:hypothetical protein
MIDVKFKKLFFDSPKVISAVDKTSRRVMCRFGALVRTIAKRSIRKRKKASAPGQPPSSHTGLLKKFIWFGYEPGSKTVVIGPARLTGKNKGEAPSLLEYGKEFPARPYMGPALEKAQPELPGMWKNSVK